jgi:hypothetical protein
VIVVSKVEQSPLKMDRYGGINHNIQLPRGCYVRRDGGIGFREQFQFEPYHRYRTLRSHALKMVQMRSLAERKQMIDKHLPVPSAKLFRMTSNPRYQRRWESWQRAKLRGKDKWERIEAVRRTANRQGAEMVRREREMVERREADEAADARMEGVYAEFDSFYENFTNEERKRDEALERREREEVERRQMIEMARQERDEAEMREMEVTIRRNIEQAAVEAVRVEWERNRTLRRERDRERDEAANRKWDIESRALCRQLDRDRNDAELRKWDRECEEEREREEGERKEKERKVFEEWYRKQVIGEIEEKVSREKEEKRKEAARVERERNRPAREEVPMTYSERKHAEKYQRTRERMVRLEKERGEWERQRGSDDRFRICELEKEWERKEAERKDEERKEKGEGKGGEKAEGKGGGEKA